MFAEVMRDDFYRAYRIRLERLLGISREKSAQDIHELIQAGFSSQTVNSLMQLQLQASSEPGQISEIQMLLNERAASNGRMSVLESDRLFRFGHIPAMAQVIFEDDTKAMRWLSKAKKGLVVGNPTNCFPPIPAPRRSNGC